MYQKVKDENFDLSSCLRSLLSVLSRGAFGVGRHTGLLAFSALMEMVKITVQEIDLGNILKTQYIWMHFYH